MAGEIGPRDHSVFLPTDSWKEAWDLWVLMLILYSAVMVPYRICFDSPAVDLWFIFEQTVTVTFITDVCFNFNTAYMEGDMWIVDRGLIAKNYFAVRAALPHSHASPLPARMPLTLAAPQRLTF